MLLGKKIAQEIIKYPDERSQVSAWETIVYHYFAVPGVSVFENPAVDWISAAASEVFTTKQQHEYLAKAIMTFESNCNLQPNNPKPHLIRKILN